jgi:histidine triad (HIT) family protein
MSECIFCKIVSGHIPAYKIYENDHVLAFLDINPVSTGHTLVIPKVHAENLAQNSLEQAVQLMTVIHDLAPKIMIGVGAAGYNLGMNHGEVAGQDVLHTHLHIMPRQLGQARNFAKQQVSSEELAKVAAQITACLSESKI